MYYGWCKRYKYSSVPIGTVSYIYLRVYIYAQYRIYVDSNSYLKIQYMNEKENGKIGESEENSTREVLKAESIRERSNI